MPEGEARLLLSAYPRQDFQAAVTLGDAEDKPGAPAFGWVGYLFRQGGKLFARVVGAHAAVAEAVKRGVRCRIHVFEDVKRGKKLLRRALKKILLPLPAPDVRLVPCGSLPYTIEDGVAVREYSFPDADDHGDYQYKPPLLSDDGLRERFGDVDDSPDAVMHRAVKRYQRRNPGTSYSDALRLAYDETNAEHRAYATRQFGISRDVETGFGREIERVPDQAFQKIDRGAASARVHELVLALMETKGIRDYTWALTLVLRAHPELAKLYRGMREDGDWQPTRWELDRR
jgi:hypothetical protein